jgi:hypothetical protein
MKRWVMNSILLLGAASVVAGEVNPCLDCDRQLRKTFEAIQAWRRLHDGRYPGGLIELQDAGLLPRDGALCPDLLREVTAADVAPGMVTSSAEARDPSGMYEYEMSDKVTLSAGDQTFPSVPPVTYTRQEWKSILLRRPFSEQIPILRCSRHRAYAPPPYNLKPLAWRNVTVSGNVYWSSIYWEWEWLGDVPLEARGVGVFFGLQGPPFSTDRPLELEAALDLRKWNSAVGDQAWWAGYPIFGGGSIRQLAPSLNSFFHGQHGRALEVDGIKWWLDGLVQLQGKTGTNGSPKYVQFSMRQFPWERKNLPVGRTFREATWLQGTVWTASVGEVAGWLNWHYADGTTEQVPIVYGKNTARFWGNPEQLEAEPGFPDPVWKHHETAESAGKEQWLRLYRQTWTNPRPAETVTSVDFITNRECRAAPFLIAVDLLK